MVSAPEKNHSPQRKFPLEQLAHQELRALRSDLKEAFYRWVRTLTPETDNEQGTGPGSFEEWLHYHEEISSDTTYVFYDRETQSLLGTASLVKQDREVKAEPEGWVLGGVNVVGQLRRQGIGTAIMRFRCIAL